MRKNVGFVITTACVALMAFMGCAKKEEVVVQEEKETIFAVNAFKTSAGDLNGYLEFGGDIQAVSSVDVLPDTAGKLSRVFVSVGDYVKKDQVIAEVDASRPGMNYSASPVKAPISGTVTSFSPAVGSTVAPSMSMGKVSSTNQLEVKTSVAERFVSKIALGQTATLTFDAFPGETFTAKVTQISPVLDTSTRTMAVSLQLDPPNNKIKVGMYTRIKLVTDQNSNAIVIPYTSVVTRSGNTVVYVVDSDNTASIQPVTVGIRVDDKVEIISGLVPQQLVVTKGQSLLDNGTKVNIISVEGDN